MLQTTHNQNVQLGTNDGQLLNANNLGFSNLDTNNGRYSSIGNTRIENIGHNANTVNIAGSQGHHVIGTNAGQVDVGVLGPNAHVLINNQHGTVTQHFPPSLSNLYQGGAQTHGPSLTGLRLDQHGSHEFDNVLGNAARHPLTALGSGVTTGVGALLGPAVLVNNAFAIPASLHASQKAVRGG